MENGTINITIKLSPSIDDLKVVSISGTMDSITTRQVDEAVLPVIGQEKSNIIFNLSDVDYLSSTGILCLLKYIVSLNAQGRQFKFVRPPSHICNILKTAGISERFDMYESLETAMSTFRKNTI